MPLVSPTRCRPRDPGAQGLPRARRARGV